MCFSNAFASGKLFSPDRIAIALAMGADLVNIARGMMISVGCIGAQKCHTNHCPVGVATTDKGHQKGSRVLLRYAEILLVLECWLIKILHLINIQTFFP